MIKKVNYFDKYKVIEGYDYIQKIPDKWEILPNIAIFDERISKGHLKEELISVTIGRGIIKQSEIKNKKDTSNEDKSNYKLVKRGDISYNKMRMWQGAVGFSKYRGIVSPAYVVLKPKLQINAEYYHYLFRTNYYNNYSKRFSYGLCDDQLNLRYSDFKRMYSIVPPIKDQNHIVDFLNKKVIQADIFIKKQQRIIEILKEQKKSIIYIAITRGLNPEIQMKNSNFEHEGIPKNWKAMKLKYCIQIMSGQVDPKRERYSSQILIAPNHIESGTGKIIGLETAKYQGADSGKYLVEKGDIVYSKIRPELRKVCISPIDGLCSADMYAIKHKKFLETDFLLYYFLSDLFTILAVNASMRVAMPKVNRETLGDFLLPIPPKFEQKQIIEYISRKIVMIDGFILQSENEIELIKEYLETIIFKAVTGEIKVG
ncbi:restriction endonuclease subunit S [Clostridium estertheticum]|uniref:restriction endonuclease subunit S n=1 Tax=Clostridium estertheticum TaxID=238834 RepID=UPI001C0B7C9F|nr:restriction endonuclease subunit S [Clostridium estertheticum]MBU3214794.1 restriction endonuclease subunit S [Clostridium estertheticum]WAG57205.1 restriction endonuclease subunit S [Clostridium estertheticum]